MSLFRPASSAEQEVLTQGNSLEEANDVVTDYITFCEAMVVPEPVKREYKVS